MLRSTTLHCNVDSPSKAFGVGNDLHLNYNPDKDKPMDEANMATGDYA